MTVPLSHSSLRYNGVLLSFSWTSRSLRKSTFLDSFGVSWALQSVRTLQITQSSMRPSFVILALCFMTALASPTIQRREEISDDMDTTSSDSSQAEGVTQSAQTSKAGGKTFEEIWKAWAKCYDRCVALNVDAEGNANNSKFLDDLLKRAVTGRILLKRNKTNSRDVWATIAASWVQVDRG